MSMSQGKVKWFSNAKATGSSSNRMEPMYSSTIRLSRRKATNRSSRARRSSSK